MHANLDNEREKLPKSQTNQYEISKLNYNCVTTFISGIFAYVKHSQ